MTTTPATQALLPVTPEDRKAAADIWHNYVAKIGEVMAEKAIRQGASDDTMIVQAFARHRKAHSLPGNVGMREALTDIFAAWDAHVAANDRTNAAIPAIDATRAERAVYDERYRASEEAKREWYRAMHRFIDNPSTRAALTPSALSGDAGEGE